jgi:thiol peroxidase
MGSAKLSSFNKGNIVVISSVPSLDTPVCDLETKRFSEEAKKLGDNVKIVTVSMDLPFAQSRWCVASHVDNIKTLSDYKNKDFGKTYGTLIKELQLLSRAVFVIDPNGTIKYVQYVKEVTEQPNFNEILTQIKALTNK